jgi:hypothetical protein
MNSLLDSELFYLYTNDVSYLVGDFGKPVSPHLPRLAISKIRRQFRTL